ncbi:hypothetical protein bcgnr5378_28870 [Bacillus cereus]
MQNELDLSQLDDQELVVLIKRSKQEDRERYIEFLLRRYQRPTNEVQQFLKVFSKEPISPASSSHSFGSIDFDRIPLNVLVEINKCTTDLSIMYQLRKRLYDLKCNKDTSNIETEACLAGLQTYSPLAAQVLYERFRYNIKIAPDEYLVLLIQQGNQHLQEDLTERLEKFVHRLVATLKNKKKLHSRFYDNDDFIQEAYMGLLNAYTDYKIERKTRFQEFARHVIFKHIVTQLKREQNKRNRATHQSLSYYKQVGGDVTDSTFLDLIRSAELTPEELLSVEESIDEAIPLFSEMELNVFSFKYFGFSYKEISKLMSTDIKAVDNGIQRAHNKGDRYRLALIEENGGIS